MSTPRVNLLPQDTAERQHAARERGAIGFALLGLVVLLGAVWLWQGTRLDAARADRDAAQSELARLQSEERELQEFAQLEQRLAHATKTLSTALARELSFAGFLQDLAAVTPTDTALTSVDLAFVDATVAADVGGTVAADGPLARPVVARATVNGETLAGHAPGVERLLLQLDKVMSFFGIYVVSSTLDPEDEDVAIFTVEIDLGTEALTGRYLQGVPESLR